MVYSLYDDEIWWIRGFGIYSMFALFIIELLGCVFCKRSSFSRGSEKMGTQFIAGNIRWGVWLVTRKRHAVHYKLEIRYEIYDLTIVDKMIKPWWGSSLEELRDATWCNVMQPVSVDSLVFGLQISTRWRWVFQLQRRECPQFPIDFP